MRVFEEPDLSGTYRVGPDGYIDYPLVGRVQVAGLLPSEMREVLREQLTTTCTSRRSRCWCAR